MLSLDDKLAIQETIYLHGHLCDAGQLDELNKVFIEAVIYDLSLLGGGQLKGIKAVRDAALKLGNNNPVGHHVTNILVSDDEDGTVRATSKAIGIRADGTCGSLVYDDILTKRDEGWRISYRKITMRKIPLQK